jgi:hypothetical protein
MAMKRFMGKLGYSLRVRGGSGDGAPHCATILRSHSIFASGSVPLAGAQYMHRRNTQGPCMKPQIAPIPERASASETLANWLALLVLVALGFVWGSALP